MAVEEGLYVFRASASLSLNFMLSDFLCHLWNLWQAKYLKEFSYVVFQNIYNLHSIFKAMVHHKLIFVYASRNGSVYLTHCLSFICEKYFLSTVELPQCLSEIKSIFLRAMLIAFIINCVRFYTKSFILRGLLSGRRCNQVTNQGSMSLVVQRCRGDLAQESIPG